MLIEGDNMFDPESSISGQANEVRPTDTEQRDIVVVIVANEAQICATLHEAHSDREAY